MCFQTLFHSFVVLRLYSPAVKAARPAVVFFRWALTKVGTNVIGWWEIVAGGERPIGGFGWHHGQRAQAITSALRQRYVT